MYKINILNTQEFEKLPKSVTKGSDISDSLGFADKQTGNAYVRYSELKELNEYLIDHEFDELMSDKSAHEDENGIRHKKFRQTAGAILPIAGSVIGGAYGGPAGAAAGGAIGGGLGGAIGGEKVKFGTNMIQPAVIGGVSGYAGSKMSGNFGTGAFDKTVTGYTSSGAPITATYGSGASGGFGNLLGNLGTMFSSGLGYKNLLGNLGSLFGGGNAYGATGASGGGTGWGVGGQSPSLYGGVLGQNPNIVQSPVTSTLNPNSGSLMSNLFGNKGLMGAGLLAGSLLKGYPKVPENPASVEQMRSMVNSGGSPLGQYASSQLQGDLSKQFQPLTEPEIQAAYRGIDDQQKAAEDQIRDYYRSIRPGSDEFTDSALRDDLNDLRERFGNMRSDMLANRTRDLSNIYENRRLSQMQTALGASNTEMQQLYQLAQLDVSRLMTQYGMDAQQAQNFKDTFSAVGGAYMQNYLNQY